MGNNAIQMSPIHAVMEEKEEEEERKAGRGLPWPISGAEHGL